MDKLHLTDDGPKPCSASVRDCPIGGDHFDNMKDAMSAYDSIMATNTFNSFNKKRLPHETIIVRGNAVNVLSEYEGQLRRKGSEPANVDNANSVGEANAYDHAKYSYDATVQTFDTSSVNLDSLDDYTNALKEKQRDNSNMLRAENSDLSEFDGNALMAENRKLSELIRDAKNLQDRAEAAENERKEIAGANVGKDLFNSSPEIGAKYITPDNRTFEVTHMSSGDNSITLNEVYADGRSNPDSVMLSKFDYSSDGRQYVRAEDNAQSTYSVMPVSDADIFEIDKLEAHVLEAQMAKNNALNELGEARTGRQLFRERAIRIATENYEEAKVNLDNAHQYKQDALADLAQKYNSGGQRNASIVEFEDNTYGVTLQYT